MKGKINTALHECKTYKELWRTLSEEFTIWAELGIIWIRIDGEDRKIGQYAKNDVIIERNKIK